jgi:hypothetical protein
VLEELKLALAASSPKRDEVRSSLSDLAHAHLPPIATEVISKLVVAALGPK